MLTASLKRRRFDAIATLALLAVGIAIFAALPALYPMGGIRPNLYLGPIIFLAAGVSIHWTADSLASLTRRAWLAPGLAAAAVGAIALAGVDDMRQDSPYVKGRYEKGDNTKAVLAFLEDNVEEGDMVYANMLAAPSMKFHQDEKPSNYHYGKAQCWSAFEECAQEMLRLAVSRPSVPNRIFLVHGNKSIREESWRLLGERISVEHVMAHRARRHLDVSLIANAKEFVGPAYETFASAYDAVVFGEPVIRSDWDVYLSENTLAYVKEPCALADTEALFFLHLIPADVNDLPDHRRQHGFDNLDFIFDRSGARAGGICLVEVDLPEYDITRIMTGQYVPVEGGYNHPWAGEVRLAE